MPVQATRSPALASSRQSQPGALLFADPWRMEPASNQQCRGRTKQLCSGKAGNIVHSDARERLSQSTCHRHCRAGERGADGEPVGREDEARHECSGSVTGLIVQIAARSRSTSRRLFNFDLLRPPKSRFESLSNSPVPHSLVPSRFLNASFGILERRSSEQRRISSYKLWLCHALQLVSIGST